ncbi:GNAT family N-acetyltransferase [Streptomyces sp. SID14515]|uniref:GNAT family N-acetyltransferase n=1 Tax=Streptomyces sp. SID14515 TaxID=2706074 RepID=UPI0013C7F93B|nr:GNAT family N-acetyltransferase [Streptomyces sp. SID14515]NEB36764.1 GNAT family N-acetyltransferase [Streptomyces sp. SID14515]
MPRAIVRPRESRDLAEAATVLTAVHESDGYPVEGVEAPEAWLSPEGLLTAWVAELDGNLVGHVAINSPQPGEEVARIWREKSGDDNSGIGVLARLFVAREARKESAGKQLVEAATTYARKRHLRLVLEVLTKDAAAIRLYERLGWQRIGETVHTFDGKQVDAVCFVAPA